MASTSSGSCAGCGKHTTNRCKGCIEGVNQEGSPSPAFYCGKACQTAHWMEHKQECQLANTRKQIYRAGEMLQAAFYVYRELTFVYNLRKVTMKGGHITMQERETDLSKGPFFPFPDAMMPDEETKKVLLAHQACSDAGAYLHQFSKKLLSGCAKQLKSVHEGRFSIERKHWRVIHFRAGALIKNRYRHEVLVVTLRNNEEYVLDPTGAQYGQFKPVLRLDHFRQEFVDLSEQQEYCRYGDMLRARYDISHGVPTDGNPKIVMNYDLRAVVLNIQFTAGVSYTVTQFEKESSKQTISSIINQPVDLYGTGKKLILSAVRRDMLAYTKHALDTYGGFQFSHTHYTNNTDKGGRLEISVMPMLQSWDSRRSSATELGSFARDAVAESDVEGDRGSDMDTMLGALSMIKVKDANGVWRSLDEQTKERCMGLNR